MNLNVSSWAIRNPIPVILLFVLLTLAGLMAFPAMKVQSFPDIDLPTVTVTASLPGAAPSQMETEVARKIENSLATLQGVKHIKSSLSDGEANITVEFRLGKPTQEAVDGVRAAVSRVRSELPANLRDPVIKKAEIADSPILTYTVASTRMDDEALSWFVDNEVARTLLAVPGVGAVTRVGGVSREVRVDLDPRPPARAAHDGGRHIAANCSMCSRTPPGAASAWVAPSSPCARWPRCNPPMTWGRSSLRLVTGAGFDSIRSRQ
jgi:multidrug efflux pump subunit AcrB